MNSIIVSSLLGYNFLTTAQSIKIQAECSGPVELRWKRSEYGVTKSQNLQGRTLERRESDGRKTPEFHREIHKSVVKTDKMARRGGASL